MVIKPEQEPKWRVERNCPTDLKYMWFLVVWSGMKRWHLHGATVNPKQRLNGVRCVVIQLLRCCFTSVLVLPVSGALVDRIYKSFATLNSHHHNRLCRRHRCKWVVFSEFNLRAVCAFECSTCATELYICFNIPGKMHLIFLWKPGSCETDSLWTHLWTCVWVFWGPP